MLECAAFRRGEESSPTVVVIVIVIVTAIVVVIVIVLLGTGEAPDLPGFNEDWGVKLGIRMGLAIVRGWF